MRRRTVLKGLGAGAVVAGGGLVTWQALDDDGDASPTTTTGAPATATLAAALAAVGARYLEEFPEEADRRLLLDALPALAGRVPERPGRALGVLAEQAATDHARGETVVLDGWVLSRTECRAAALYAL